MTFKPPSTWQATCPRCTGAHINLRNKSTCCRQTRTVTGDESEDLVLRTLKYWAVCCMHFGSRSEHQRWRPLPKDAPSEEELNRYYLPTGWDSGSEAAAPSPPLPPAPKAKATTSGKAKARPKAKPKGRSAKRAASGSKKSSTSSTSSSSYTSSSSSTSSSSAKTSSLAVQNSGFEYGTPCGSQAEASSGSD